MSAGHAASLMSLSGVVGLGGTLCGGALAYVYGKERTIRLLILSGAANLLQVPVLLIGLSASGPAGFRIPFLVPGAGLGPQIVGFLSDSLAGAGDAKALAHAVGALVLAAGLAGIFFLAALRSVPTGLDRALSERAETARPAERA